MLSLLLPHGYLQTAAEHNDPWAPLFMTAVAIPAYATPMTGMVQLASMFQHGNSVGAAFSLLVLGAGANLGLIVWMARIYGLKRSAVWFAMLLAIVVGLAYLVDKPLYPHGVEPAGHTHAFDIYCSPFHPHVDDPLSRTCRTMGEKTAAHETLALIAMGAFLIAGLALACCDRTGRIERWLEQQPAENPRLDIVLSGRVIGGSALVGLIVFSIMGCYIYYPPPHDIFEEMQIVNTEVVASATSKDWDTALYWIPIYDDWTRKLQVSIILRGHELTPYRRAKANVLRDKLELLEHEVEDQEVEESHKLGMEVIRAYQRMRAAYAVGD